MTWLILESIKKNKRSYYKVQCDCGYIGERRADWVDSNRTICCKSCSAKNTAKQYPPPINWKNIGGLSATHFGTIKFGALRRNLSFKITQQFLWELFQKQNGKCALSNLDLVLEARLKNHNPDWTIITASVDRIDSTKGYTEDNVQWVHKDINFLKNDLAQEKFIWLCSLVAHHVNPDPSVVNANKVTTKEQRLESEEATNNLSTSARHPSGCWCTDCCTSAMMDDDIV